jgi:hypothetical protein
LTARVLIYPNPVTLMIYLVKFQEQMISPVIGLIVMILLPPTSEKEPENRLISGYLKKMHEDKIKEYLKYDEIIGKYGDFGKAAELNKGKN